MEWVDVYDLRTKTPKPVARYSCDPRSAVIAAYAQSLGDFNTWGYADTYGHLVRTGRCGIHCGDFSARTVRSDTP